MTNWSHHPGSRPTNWFPTLDQLVSLPWGAGRPTLDQLVSPPLTNWFHYPGEPAVTNWSHYPGGTGRDQLVHYPGEPADQLVHYPREPAPTNWFTTLGSRP